MRALKIAFVTAVALLCTLTATAFAANAMLPDSDSLWDLLRPVYDAFTAGHKLYAGMLALVVVVALIKRYAPEAFGLRKFVYSDIGGALLTLFASFGGAMATALASGAGASWATVKTALYIAFGAAGGYSLIKRLIVDPILRPMAAKAPSWSQPIFMVVFWMFDRPTAIQAAEVAGDAAVAAKPAAGVDGVTGAPDEVQ